ncbi:hypothetical protein Goarm_003486 [Gossypium armourianum]|uniref:Pentatricopeptide repeat-containing protein n=1 Tax=Gossypium armourianum TaxID=34283 RepID=A0A7J9K3I6_9ROSI|nr:hypothetical protein [Gossypium armourianum]
MVASRKFPNLVTYLILLDGLCKSGTLEDALKFFRAGLELNITSYTIVIDGLCKVEHMEDAKELFRELSVNVLKPNVYTYAVVINGFCKE